VKYPLVLTGALAPPRVRVFDADGVLVAHATGPTFVWKDNLTLFGDEGGGQILAKMRAEGRGPLASYAIATADDTPLGSVHAGPVSLLRQQRELRDAAGVSVGIVRSELRSRPVEGAVTRLPILRGIARRIVTVLDTVYTIEMPVGTKVLEALYRRSWATHRFDVRRLGDIPRYEDLVVPTLAILLLLSVRASQSSS
jgi:hypothetical protein